MFNTPTGITKRNLGHRVITLRCKCRKPSSIKMKLLSLEEISGDTPDLAKSHTGAGEGVREACSQASRTQARIRPPKSAINAKSASSRIGFGT